MTINIEDRTGATKITPYTKDRYIDKNYMEAEWQQVWRNNWLLAGLTSDVSRPGDYFIFDLGREQILLTCDEQAVVHAFYNVCQHRGNRLVTKERGQSPTLRCAYHAWTYELDGSLKAVPYAERFTEPEQCESRALAPVQVETWNGFVFICLADEPPDFQEWLGPLDDILSPYHFDRMVLIEDQTVRLNCNWKAVIDNFSELYHVDFLHPQHKRMVDCCNDTVRLFHHGHTGVEVPGATVNPRFPVPDEPTDIQSMQLTSIGLDPADFKGRVMDVREAVQKQKREVGAARGMDYSDLRDDQLSDVWQYNLFPNTVLSFTPEHCWVLRPRPHPDDPNRCLFDKLSMVMFADPDTNDSGGEILGPGRATVSASGFKSEGYARPGRDEFDHEAVVSGRKSMTDTIDQDVALLGQVQAGMRSAGFQDIFLSEDEIRVQHFHQQLDRLITPDDA